jgi:lipopolysaccharide/colanic/teichoic acid biosynthesis glycosyltransferase
VFAIIAAAILVEDGRPIFFACSRVGHRGRPLQVLKFRKMARDASGLPLTQSRDDRLTRVGARLLKWKLDELPQLWNVFRGDMSLVGPRPEDRRFVSLHAGPYQRIVRVKPGITGLSQLAFARESAILDPADPMKHYVDRLLPQKMAMDTLYAERQSTGFDLAILLWTFAAVALGWNVAVDRHTGHLGVRRRPPATAPAQALVLTLTGDRP